MPATVFIVHRNDTLLRAMPQLLASEGYRVRSAETLDALLADLASNPSPAILVLDEDGAGSAWVEQLACVPARIPRIALTWNPTATFPADVTPLGKPFRARDLLDTLSHPWHAKRPNRHSGLFVCDRAVERGTAERLATALEPRSIASARASSRG